MGTCDLLFNNWYVRWECLKIISCNLSPQNTHQFRELVSINLPPRKAQLLANRPHENTCCVLCLVQSNLCTTQPLATYKGKQLPYPVAYNNRNSCYYLYLCIQYLLWKHLRVSNTSSGQHKIYTREQKLILIVSSFYLSTQHDGYSVCWPA